MWKQVAFLSLRLPAGVVLIAILCSFLLSGLVKVHAQTTTYTYQGKLNDSNVPSPTNGTYDMQFKLFDALTAGNPIGATITNPAVQVTNGIFALELDFGASSLPGADRWLEVSVRPAGSSGAYATLAPRQKITSAPYAVQSLNAAQLGGVPANQYVTIASIGNSFIQNNTSGMPQPSSTFNISGNGTVGGTVSGNVVNAATQYNLGGLRILSVDVSGSTNNTFTGVQAGTNTTTSGVHNSFYGAAAGFSNATGGDNSFFGFAAGQSSTGFSNSFFGSLAGTGNTTGSENAFFGRAAGLFNTTGSNNSFFGRSAGNLNITGTGNSYFGRGAGQNNFAGNNNAFFGDLSGSSNTASGNSFFGALSGTNNTTGNFNAFFGSPAGQSNTTGSANAFFGSGAGNANTTGSSNSFFGTFAGAGNTTAIGNSFFGNNTGTANAGNFNSFFGGFSGQVNTSGTQNTFAGYQSGTDNTTGGSNSFFGYGAGLNNTTAGDNSFFGMSSGGHNQTGARNSFYGSAAGFLNTLGDVNTGAGSDSSYFGYRAGFNATGGGNSFFGSIGGTNNTTGFLNTFIGYNAGNPNPTLQVSNATAIGSNATVSQSNSLVLGDTSVNVGIGTTAPLAKLDTRGSIFVGLTSVPDIAVNGSQGNALYVANDQGNQKNSFRVDGFQNNLYLIARSAPGATAGAGLVFRTATAGGGEVDRMLIRGDGTVNISGSTDINDVLFLHNVISVSGGTDPLCLAFNAVTFCSSSLRYKTNVASYREGLKIINRLRPISFDWKKSGTHDVGLGAEEVEQVEPRFTFRNQKGEIEGVKYGQLSAVFINAFKEQQAQIQQQRELIGKQQRELTALKQLVCRSHRRAAICQ